MWLIWYANNLQKHSTIDKYSINQTDQIDLLPIGCKENLWLHHASQLKFNNFRLDYNQLVYSLAKSR
jgi:hypothetical protein